MAEFDEKVTVCDSCKWKDPPDRGEKPCTLLKTAHVPMYGWVCEDCREEWALG